MNESCFALQCGEAQRQAVVALNQRYMRSLSALIAGNSDTTKLNHAALNEASDDERTFPVKKYWLK